MFGPQIKLSGMAFTLFDGAAYWADTLFRQVADPYHSEYVSQMWIKDALPAGAVVPADSENWTFITP